MPPEMLAAVTADANLALIYVRKAIARFKAIPPGQGNYSVGIALTALTFVEETAVTALALLATRKNAPQTAPPAAAGLPKIPPGTTMN